jgi:hypothetical protein
VTLLVIAAWRPVAGILLAGLLRFLTDVQVGGKLVPSLVDGALTSAYAAAGVIGLPIAVTGVQGLVARARAAQPKAPPPGGLKPQ